MSQLYNESERLLSMCKSRTIKTQSSLEIDYDAQKHHEKMHFMIAMKVGDWRRILKEVEIDKNL